MLHLVPDADDADVGDVFAAVELGFELCGGDLEALWSRKRLVTLHAAWIGTRDEHVLYLMSSFLRSVM